MITDEVLEDDEPVWLIEASTEHDVELFREVGGLILSFRALAPLLVHCEGEVRLYLGHEDGRNDDEQVLSEPEGFFVRQALKRRLSRSICGPTDRARGYRSNRVCRSRHR